eukprot:350080-Chlamydomonas_euryale.AAC.1
MGSLRETRRVQTARGRGKWQHWEPTSAYRVDAACVVPVHAGAHACMHAAHTPKDTPVEQPVACAILHSASVQVHTLTHSKACVALLGESMTDA